MSPAFPIILAFGLGLIGWLAARARARTFRRAVRAGGVRRMHSLPAYHGWFVALAILVPALLFAAVWSSVTPGLAEAEALKSPAAAQLPAFGFQRDSILAEARNLTTSPDAAAFNPIARQIAVPMRAAHNFYGTIGLVATLLIGFAAGALAFLRLRPDFTARTQVERAIMAGLLFASLIAVLTTFGILASLVFETTRFFSMVSPGDFLLGTHWGPDPMATPGPNAGDD